MASIQRISSSAFFLAAAILAWPCIVPARVCGQDALATADPLAARILPFQQAISGGQQRFEIRGEATLPVDGASQTVTIRAARFSGESFDLDLTHTDYAISIRRREETTAFALPKHDVVFLGHGQIDPHDRLTPEGIVERLLTTRTSVSTYAPLVLNSEATALSGLLTTLLGVTFDAPTQRGNAGADTSFRFEPDGSLLIESKTVDLRLSLPSDPGTPADVDHWPQLRPVRIERDELERQLVRGVRRGLEILRRPSY